MLAEVAIDNEIDRTLLSVVAPDGTIEGTVPEPIAARASDGVTDTRSGDVSWLVQRAPLRAAGQRAGVAQIILARPIDAGLAGLFPHARLVIVVLAALLAFVALGGAWLARLRDLNRRGRPKK